MAIRNLAQSDVLAQAKASLTVPNGIDENTEIGYKIREEFATKIYEALKEEQRIP